MNLGELEKKLLAAARTVPPNDSVPFAFEKRVLARLRHATAPDLWSLWAPALWRSSAACVAVTVLMGAWVLLTPVSRPLNDLSQEIETIVLAGAEQELPAD